VWNVLNVRWNGRHRKPAAVRGVDWQGLKKQQPVIEDNIFKLYVLVLKLRLFTGNGNQQKKNVKVLLLQAQQ
jgi:hypothetical protein